MEEKKIDVHWLRKQLLEEGMTLAKVGEVLGLSRQCVHHYCKKYGISISSERKAKWYAQRMGLPELGSPDWLLTQKAIRGNIGIEALARELKVSASFLEVQIKRLGLLPQDFLFKAPYLIIECENCGRIFKRRLLQVQRYRHHFCSRFCKGRWLGKGKFRKDAWTVEEEKFVRENWQRLSDREIGKIIGRSKEAVRVHRCRMLKLKRR